MGVVGIGAEEVTITIPSNVTAPLEPGSKVIMDILYSNGTTLAKKYSSTVSFLVLESVSRPLDPSGATGQFDSADYEEPDFIV